MEVIVPDVYAHPLNDEVKSKFTSAQIKAVLDVLILDEKCYELLNAIKAHETPAPYRYTSHGYMLTKEVRDRLKAADPDFFEDVAVRTEELINWMGDTAGHKADLEADLAAREPIATSTRQYRRDYLNAYHRIMHNRHPTQEEIDAASNIRGAEYIASPPKPRRPAYAPVPVPAPAPAP